MLFNPLRLTLEKLDKTQAALESAILSGDWDSAESHIALFRDYKNCYFCQAYRTVLEGSSKGVCDACPCHKVGEETIGRKLSYNGCYKTGSYRELVRLAWWFMEDKSALSANALIQAIEDTKKDMIAHTAVLDRDIER